MKKTILAFALGFLVAGGVAVADWATLERFKSIVVENKVTTGDLTVNDDVTVAGDLTVSGDITLTDDMSLDALTVTTITGTSAQNLAVNTSSNDKTVRINSREFTATSGDVIGLQSKPDVEDTGTASVYGAQFSPRFSDASAGGSAVGVEASPILQGTSGNLSGDWRAFDAILEDGGAGRTVSGTATAMRVRSNAASTVTGGAHVFHVLNEEAGLAWTSLAKFDSGVAFVAAPTSTDAISGAGYIKVSVGGTLYRIPLLEDE